MFTTIYMMFQIKLQIKNRVDNVEKKSKYNSVLQITINIQIVYSNYMKNSRKINNTNYNKQDRL